MSARKCITLFSLFVIGLLNISAICFPALADALSATDKAAAAPDMALMTAIGSAARESIEKVPNTPSINGKIQIFINLADAEIRVGNLQGASETMADARSTPGLPDLFLNTLFAVSFLAGDTEGAMKFIQGASPENQMGALGYLATTQINNGDNVGAKKTIALIDALYNKTPHVDPTPVRSISQKPNFQDAHDMMLNNITKVFAEKGDITDAQSSAAKISNKGFLSMALSEVAKAQHKAGDQQAAETTLRQFKPAVEEFYAKDPVQVGFIEVLAYGSSGEYEKAKAIIAALPLKASRDAAMSRLCEVLAKDGDITHAREIADASGDPDNFILVAKMQHKAGDDLGSHATFLAAHEALKTQSSLAPIDRLQRVSQIVEGLISAGAFSDAVSISAEMDELNRPQHIVSAIREEIKRGDLQAIRETAPIALKIAEEATLFNEKDLADFAAILGKAGLMDDSKSIMAIAQKNAERLVGWQRMDALNAIKDAQTALGDKEGAVKTEQAIQQETTNFNKEIEQVSTEKPSEGSVEGDANTAGAVKLLQQLQTTNDPQEKKNIIQRALALVGNDGQKLEALMFMSARYSPELQKLKIVDEDIAHQDFTGATTIIGSMTGGGKDAALEHLSRAQAQAGQYKAAFDTASAIVAPYARASSLTSILNAANNKTP